MRPYYKRTFNDLVLDTKLRLAKFVNIYNIDESYLNTIANFAARNVILTFLPVRLSDFVERLQVTHNTVLPTDFADYLRLVIYYQPPDGIPGNSIPVEARFVDIREWYRLTNWRLKNKWNQGKDFKPIFTISGSLRSGGLPYRKVIYIAPNNDFQTGQPPSGFEYYQGQPLVGILEYYSIPEPSMLPNDPLPFPDELYEYAVLETMDRFLTLTTDIRLLPSLHQSLYDSKRNILNSFVQKMLEEQKELETFTEPAPPFYNPQTQTEEVPNNLMRGRQ